MSAPASSPRVFISYAHADRAWLRSLVTHLHAALGNNDPDFIFFDEHSLRSGDAWNERLQQEVMARPIFVLALTPQSVTSQYVGAEVELALRETAANPNRRFISLMVQHCDPAQLSPMLLSYQITDFTQQPFNIAFAGLVGAIRSYVGVWNQQRPPQPGYAPPIYQPVAPARPQAPTPTPPMQAPAATPSSVSPAPTRFHVRSDPDAPIETEMVGGPPAPPSPQALQMAKDVHQYFVEESWTEVIRRGEFAITLPENRQNFQLRGEMAMAYASLKRWDKAAEHVDPALLAFSWRSDFWLTKARIQMAFGQEDDALISYDRAYGFAIADPGARRTIKQMVFAERRDLLMGRGQFDEALAQIEDELGGSGNDIDRLRERAELLLKLGIRDEAAKMFLARRLTGWMQRLGYTLHAVRGVELVDAPMVAIPEGEFLFGSDPEKDSMFEEDETPQLPVKTGAYEIGRFPVTVGEYERFVRAGGAPPAPMTIAGTVYNWETMLQHPDYPVAGITWNDALAYVRWLAEITGEPWRLLTEPEWEKAARWDEERQHARIYPWGDVYDISRCGTMMNLGAMTRVGSFPTGASPYGVMDMEGAVGNLCSTIYRRYPYVTRDGREDLDALVGSTIVRGRGGNSGERMQRAASRNSTKRDVADRWIGFRVARGVSPQGAQASGNGAAVAQSTGNGQPVAASSAQQLTQDAHFAFVTGRMEEAATIGEQALQASENATSAQLLIETANAWATLQRWDEAAVASKRALSLDQFNAEMWQVLARAQRGRGQINEALTYYNHALAVVAPEKRTLRLTLLTEQRQLLMEQLRWSEALGVLDEEIRLSAGDQERINLRAEILRQLG